jgi:hypothetical protein
MADLPRRAWVLLLRLAQRAVDVMLGVLYVLAMVGAALG